eukprot:COSAG03_NODE_468_length_7665_cov_6.302670_7_plen_45_part_00
MEVAAGSTSRFASGTGGAMADSSSAMDLSSSSFSSIGACATPDS